MKKYLKSAMVLLTAVLFAGCRPASAPETPPPAAPAPELAEQSEPAGTFDIPSLDGSGGTVSLSAHAGKVVLLDFWATWCPPCRFELPSLNKLYGELKDRGFVIIGMTVDQGSAEKVQPAVAKFGLTYPVGLAGADVQAAYGGIRAVPTKFLLGKDGQVIETFVGLVPEEELRAKIEKALAQ